MALFRRRGGRPPGPDRAERRAEVEQVKQHLVAFIQAKPGVEAFIEPPTTLNPPTVLLVASSGEWTRRRVPDPALIRGLAEDLAVPVYDVQLVGYPQRMRDWNDRRKREAKGDPT